MQRNSLRTAAAHTYKALDRTYMDLIQIFFCLPSMASEKFYINSLTLYSFAQPVSLHVCRAIAGDF